VVELLVDPEEPEEPEDPEVLLVVWLVEWWLVELEEVVVGQLSMEKDPVQLKVS
jgi:hypothetical protein